MCESNIYNDPLGCKLPSCNDYSSPPKKDPPKKKAPLSPPPKKPAASPMVQYHCYNYVYPQPMLCIMQQPAVIVCPPMKKKPEKKPDPPAHVCVNCSAKNKCKDCKKKEEAGKKWVYHPTFSNPRTPRKSIFSK